MSRPNPTDLAAMRQDFVAPGLYEADAEESPFDQFQKWFTDAKAGGIKEPNAMVLATASPDGVPDARVVLLKGMNPANGFSFFTNYQSAKAAQLERNARVALVFYWDRLYRQVRITGAATPLGDDVNDEYFRGRPRGSQIGAWASPQSSVLSGRDELERSYAQAEQRFGDGEIPRPPHWGGYVVRPEAIEFWQGQPSRLHDRLVYERDGDGWKMHRLSP